MRKKIVILGAGISGLALHWFLKKTSPDLEIITIEKSSHIGGWVRTIEKNGYLFELGPHTLRGASQITMQLIEDLGLQDQIILAHPYAKSRFLFENGKMNKIPASLLGCLFSPFLKEICIAIFKDFSTTRLSDKDISIYDFVKHRFGAKVAERLIDPMISGIYAGNIKQLSLCSCFPLWQKWEQQYGSVFKGVVKYKEPSCPIFSFKKGMSTLVNALNNDSIILNSQASSITFENEKPRVHLMNGKSFSADHLFSTLPLHSLGKLLPTKITIPQLPHASVAVVNLGFRKSVLKQQGFGYLIAQREKEDILGGIWLSSIFPEQNVYPEETRISIMIGGMHRPELCQQSENALINIALQALKNQIGCTDIPDAIHVNIAHNAIPQYPVGFKQSIDDFKKQLSQISTRITCLGTSFSGVSLNDCIQHAYSSAKINPNH